MKNARLGLDDRLLAAGITGRKAGEACTVKKRLFVHPEEKTQESFVLGAVWHSLSDHSCRLSLLQRQSVGSRAHRLSSESGTGDRHRPGVRKPHQNLVISVGLPKPPASVSSPVE